MHPPLMLKEKARTGRRRSTTAAARSDFLDAAGVTVEGDGRTLLLVNGLLHGADLWEPVTRALGPGYRMVSFDFPHQNGSPLAGNYVGFDRYCDFVEDLIEALDLDPSRSAAFGFSIGGDVLRTLAVERGVRFETTILGASAPAGVERFWKEFFNTARDLLGSGAFEAFVRLVAFQFHSPLYLDAFPKLSNLMHLRYRKRFPDVRNLEALLRMPLTRPVPDPVHDAEAMAGAHFIHCLYDHLVPLGPARTYAREVGAHLHEIEAGHSFTAELPEETAALLKNILEGRV
jgi:pimeloyl-ACP methyl ester carboxylesterase